jgi:HlyD family secretion protein
MTTPASPSRAWAPKVAIGLLLAAAAVGGTIAWMKLKPQGLPVHIASGNGRLEATDIDVATRSGGRLKDLLVQEGDFVASGQVLAVMDTQTLDADLHRAQAQVIQARNARATAAAMLAQREQSILTTQALVAQRQAEEAFALKQLQRAKELVGKGFLPPQKLDEAQAQTQSAKAALSATQSQVAEARAAVVATRSQVVEAESAIETALAVQARIQADMNDTSLRAPRAGRVQLLSARPGEVLGAGGRVLSLVDLSDVYMTFFLPETPAGRVAIGTQVRLILDAAPQYVIPAKVSFVASVAQFTPKTVETSAERQKMVFKVKAQVDPELLARHRTQVKTGMPGMAYVNIDPQQAWPDKLAIALPAEAASSQTVPAPAPASH